MQVLARNLKVRVAGGVAARVQLRAARRREGAAERRVRVRTGRVKGLVDALSDGRHELEQTPPEGLLPPRLQQRGLEGSETVPRKLREGSPQRLQQRGLADRVDGARKAEHGDAVQEDAPVHSRRCEETLFTAMPYRSPTRPASAAEQSESDALNSSAHSARTWRRGP